MSQKKPLQQHIDQLCTELGIEDKPYTEKTSIPDLQKIVDDLEAKLPDEESEPESDETETLEGGDLPPEEPETLEVESGTEIGLVDKSELPDDAVIEDAGVEVESGTEIGLVDKSELPDDAVIEDAGVEVESNESGDLLIKAKTTIRLQSHGQPLKISKDQTAYVDEQAAMDAVEDGLAVLLSK